MCDNPLTKWFNYTTWNGKLKVNMSRIVCISNNGLMDLYPVTMCKGDYRKSLRLSVRNMLLFKITSELTLSHDVQIIITTSLPPNQSLNLQISCKVHISCPPPFFLGGGGGGGGGGDGLATTWHNWSKPWYDVQKKTKSKFYTQGQWHTFKSSHVVSLHNFYILLYLCIVILYISNIDYLEINDHHHDTRCRAQHPGCFTKVKIIGKCQMFRLIKKGRLADKW